MRRRRPLIALGSALWFAACSAELSSQGDVVAIDNPPPAVVVAPGGNSATPPAPGGPSSGSSTGGVGGIAAVADAGSGGAGIQPDAGTTTTGDAGSASADAAAPREEDAGNTTAVPFALASPDFAAGSELPELHACQGGDQSPAFVWQGAPAGTKSFAMVLTTHTAFLGSNIEYQRWVMWNIPATRSTLPAGIDEGHSPSDVPGAVQASNETDAAGGNIGGGNNGGGNSGGNPGGWGGGTFGGGFTAGAGGSFAGGSGGDARQGRRYRGPCSYGFPQTFEFVLYALGEEPEPPEWEVGITPDEIVEWLTTEATVMGTARLEGVAP